MERAGIETVLILTEICGREHRILHTRAKKRKEPHRQVGHDKRRPVGEIPLRGGTNVPPELTKVLPVTDVCKPAVVCGLELSQAQILFTPSWAAFSAGSASDSIFRNYWSLSRGWEIAMSGFTLRIANLIFIFLVLLRWGGLSQILAICSRTAKRSMQSCSRALATVARHHCKYRQISRPCFSPSMLSFIVGGSDSNSLYRNQSRHNHPQSRGFRD